MRQEQEEEWAGPTRGGSFPYGEVLVIRRNRVRAKMQQIGQEMEKRKERSLGRSRSQKKGQDQEEADEGEIRSWSVREGAVCRVLEQ